MSDFDFYDPTIERELYETGRVKDCNHLRCHSPMGDGFACLRHHFAYLQDRLERAESDVKQYRAKIEALKTEVDT